MEITEKIRKLNLPLGEYVVFGSAPLEVRGIRKSKDIDLAVTADLFDLLKASGEWKEVVLSNGLKPLQKGNIEAYIGWFGCEGYKPVLQHLIDTAEMFDGIPFANMGEVVLWKTAMGRKKDLEDLKLISTYRSRLF